MKFNWKAAGYGLLIGFGCIAIVFLILGQLTLFHYWFGANGAMIAYGIFWIVAGCIFAGFVPGFMTNTEDEDEPEV